MPYTTTYPEDTEPPLPDYCSMQINVYPAGIYDNELLIPVAAATVDYRYICVPISRTAGPGGLVGRKTGTIDTGWCNEYECVEQDTDGNCTKTGCKTYLRTSYDYYVYRIGKCYDDYDEFAAYFYSKCGGTPDSNGKYPAIFNGSPRDYMNYSSSAGACLNNYWRTHADRLFRPRVNIKTTSYELSHKILWYAVNYELDDANTPTGPSHATYEYISLVTNRDDTSEIKYKTGGSAEYDESGKYWNYYAASCAERWDSVPEIVSKINEKIQEDKQHKDRFVTYSVDTKSIPYSDRYHYNSQCHPGITIYTYIDGIDVHSYQYYHKHYGIIEFLRPEPSTEGEDPIVPSAATGVKCLITGYYTQYNRGKYCTLTNEGKDTSDAPLPPDAEYLYKNQIVTFRFGDKIETRVLDNQVTFQIINERDCKSEKTCKESSADCQDYNRPEFGTCSSIGDSAHTEEFVCTIAVIAYTFD